MRSLLYADATDLNHWADRRDAQGDLPQLLRKLVLATVDSIQSISFRAGEGVQLGGWDGHVVVERGNAFVPDGVSVWELGTGSNPKAKAEEDYGKRSEEPCGVGPRQATFIFVTPRRWSNKDDWVAEKRSQGVWRDVRVYDGDDLETWLETAPSVHVWLSILLGKISPGVSDLESFWADWSAVTQPAISPELVLAGRSEASNRVRSWLEGQESMLTIRAGSREEAIAVFVASVMLSQDSDRESLFARCAIIDDKAAWTDLATARQSLVLVPRFDDAKAIAHATCRGHRVVITLGRSDNTGKDCLKVPRLLTSDANAALQACGIEQQKADELAKLGRKSFIALRRKMAVAPSIQRPGWARPEDGPSLVPALLAGAWDEAKEADKQVLAALAGTSYEELIQRVRRWAHDDDPPVRQVGDAWLLVSKEDAWELLARYVSSDILKRFGTVVLRTLGAPNPKFDLPQDEQWKAGLTGQTPQHSEILRDGLADALAILGTRGSEIPVSAGATASDYPRRIVGKLLANADWRVWASQPSLRSLAEAAPEELLAAVEAGTAGADPMLVRLFADRDSTWPLGPTSFHTELLWALELLAWSPAYLGRAALCLARLARLDPGGKLGNRPKSSLRHIFLLWLPQTSASLPERLAAIDLIRKKEAAVAWKLLLDLLPMHHGYATYNPVPRWRDWAPEEPKRTPHGEWLHGLEEVVSRMVEDVGENADRWKSLIDSIDTLPNMQFERICERLETLDADSLDDGALSSISAALRSQLSRHRAHPDADWAMAAPAINRLTAISERFTPKDVRHRYGWLFTHAPELPEGGLDSGHSYEEYWESVVRAQEGAVRVAYERGGMSCVLELAHEVELPARVGSALATSGLAASEEDDILRNYLASDDSALGQLARGYIHGRIESLGRDWAEKKQTDLAAVLSPAQRAILLHSLPWDERTNSLVVAAGHETEVAYWKVFVPFGSHGRHAEFAARMLDKHGRHYAALQMLANEVMQKRSVSPTLIADILERSMQMQEPDMPLDSFDYKVGHLLDVLAASDAVEKPRVASLEWALLPAMGFHGRPPKVLYKELSHNPELFADLVCCVFRGEGEEPRNLSPDERARGQCAFRLLDMWRGIPGTDNAGKIDSGILLDWVSKARNALAEKKRRGIGDQQIGQTLSGSPPGSDGAWPHPAVRDVIEEVASEDMEKGLEVGLYNGRGVVTKNLGEGGKQERELAATYEAHASTVSTRWPRTAAMLRSIAKTYRSEALHEDQRTEMEQDRP